MIAVEALAPEAGTAGSCRGLGIARAAVYRRRVRATRPAPEPRPRPGRSLAVAERQAVLDALHVGRFADKAPPEVYATLLDEGVYLCSIRTMYRVLAEHGEVRERRDQLRHPQYRKPELLATRPNEVWSWDITKLAGPAKWTYFYLYVILDIFSRYVVGWMVAHRESAELARRLLDDTCEKQVHEGIFLAERHALVLHELLPLLGAPLVKRRLEVDKEHQFPPAPGLTAVRPTARAEVGGVLRTAQREPGLGARPCDRAGRDGLRTGPRECSPRDRYRRPRRRRLSARAPERAWRRPRPLRRFLSRERRRGEGDDVEDRDCDPPLRFHAVLPSGLTQRTGWAPERSGSIAGGRARSS